MISSPTSETTFDLKQYMEDRVQRCNIFLSRILNDCQDEHFSSTFQFFKSSQKQNSRLLDAMHYTIFNGGKRIRPLLVYATGEALGASQPELDAAAGSLELIHCYSLVHDDLPAMDNDDFRRGKPSCHRAFDEATAILVGDALQTLAFQTLANHHYNLHSDKTKLEMIRILAEASGCQGMAQGQSIDMNNHWDTENQNEGFPTISFNDLQQHTTDPLKAKSFQAIDTLITLNQKKTGALIVACVKLAAAAKGNVSEKTLQSLQHFAECLGLAFQIQDDILDISGDPTLLGKTHGKDQVHQKLTFPRLLGLEQAKSLASDVLLNALQQLQQAFPTTTSPQIQRLAALSKFFIERCY